MTDKTTPSRRTVLKATGTMALGGMMLSGTASATEPEEIRFCGCSQVCVDPTEDNHSYRIVYATETEDGYSCRINPAIDETEHSDPGCYEAGDGEKVIGVLGGNRYVYHNPNKCAEKALADVSLNDCTGCGDNNTCDKEVTYTQEGRHKYKVESDRYNDMEEDVVVKTRRCKPPEEWDDSDQPPDKDRGRKKGK